MTTDLKVGDETSGPPIIGKRNSGEEPLDFSTMTTQTPHRASRRERLIRKLAGLMVRGVYRKVDVYRADHRIDGPQLSVSNHFGGLADPLLLVYAMPRLPRIMARDVIWKIPLAGWIMRWVGAIPVHKPEDRGKGSNDIMFASAYQALEDRTHLMIFPEGITRDQPSIAPIKTGAARIVLGARARGVEGIRITPAGIHYEDKASLRSSVSVLIGPPIDLDANVDQYFEPGDDQGPENRPAVRALTADIERELRRVAPDFSDWEEARSLTHGAEIVLRTIADDPTEQISLAGRDAIAGHLGRKSPEARAAVVGAVDDYDTELSNLGLTDEQLLSGLTGRQFLWWLVGWLIVTIVLLPFALVGVVINWIPYIAVKAVGLLRVAPAVKSTTKPLTAIVAFGITWGLAIWGALFDSGWRGALLATLLMPVYFGAVIVVQERLQTLWKSFQTWRRLRKASDSEDVIAAKRREVLEVLVEAL
ncbi:MAG: hypothetical protein GY788_02340 [bacterium]|nr:hypothetical protein [bacterium]